MIKKDKAREQELENRLRELGVRPTAVRIMLGKLLRDAPAPMSALEIEMILDTVDRSTITRSLGVFGDCGLLHIVDDHSGVPKYEWCNNPSSHSPADSHPHFHCIRCRRTICLHHISMPETELPEGFELHDSSYLISGLCPECSRRRKSKETKRGTTKK